MSKHDTSTRLASTGYRSASGEDHTHDAVSPRPTHLIDPPPQPVPGWWLQLEGGCTPLEAVEMVTGAETHPVIGSNGFEAPVAPYHRGIGHRDDLLRLSVDENRA
jgi:hypothetical protein